MIKNRLRQDSIVGFMEKYDMQLFPAFLMKINLLGELMIVCQVMERDQFWFEFGYRDIL